MVKSFLFVLFIFLINTLLACSNGTSIKNVELKNVKDGKEIRIKNFNFDFAVLYVWSGTCVGHQKDLKRLNSLQERLGSDVKIFSIAILMEREAVKATFEDLKIKPRFISLYDPKANITEAVNIIALPSTIIIDKEGNILKELVVLPSAESIIKIVKN